MSGDHPAINRPRFTTMTTAVFRRIGSLEVTTVLLVYMFLLVLVGTVYQIEHTIHETTSRFFDAWIFHVGVVPLPSGLLVFAAAGLNLFAATLTRIPFRWDRAGILITHVGLLLFIVGGIATRVAFRDTVLALEEGASDSYSYDLRSWDLVVTDHLSGEETTVNLPLENETFEAGGLQIAIERLLMNSAVTRSGPTAIEHVDGGTALARPQARPDTPVPGLIVRVRDRTVLLHGGDPFAFRLDEQFSLRVLPSRVALPARITLVTFHSEFYPGTQTPRFFASDVEITRDGVTRTARISMNQPLRLDDFTFYQLGYDSQRGLPNVSLFQVVHNPHRVFPYAIGALVALGLVLHAGPQFARKGDRSRT